MRLMSLTRQKVATSILIIIILCWHIILLSVSSQQDKGFCLGWTPCMWIRTVKLVADFHMGWDRRGERKGDGWQWRVEGRHGCCDCIHAWHHTDMRTKPGHIMYCASITRLAMGSVALLFAPHSHEPETHEEKSVKYFSISKYFLAMAVKQARKLQCLLLECQALSNFVT